MIITTCPVHKNELDETCRGCYHARRNNSVSRYLVPQPTSIASAPLFDKRPLPCIYEGPVIRECKSCNQSAKDWRSVRQCNHAEHTNTLTGGPGECVRNAKLGKISLEGITDDCSECDDYIASAPRAIIHGQVIQGLVGIVVGCYGWPKLAEVQINYLREFCGKDVAILLADDGSPHEKDFVALTQKYANVFFAGNAVRLGHYAGDLSVFRKGMLWAKARNFRVLVKLSMRTFIMYKEWFPRLVGLVSDGPAETVMGRILDGKDKGLYFRTEAVGMRVDAWSQPDIMDRLKGDMLTNPTELRINDIIVNKFNGRVLEWGEISGDRYKRNHNLIFHCTHGRDEYVAWADRYGLTLDDDFHANGHQNTPGWKRG